MVEFVQVHVDRAALLLVHHVFLDIPCRKVYPRCAVEVIHEKLRICYTKRESSLRIPGSVHKHLAVRSRQQALGMTGGVRSGAR